MTAWLDGKLLAFDLETTGKDPLTASIVTASTVLIDPATGAKTVTEWLADPGIEIPPETTAIHGVTTAHAREHGQRSHIVVDQVTQAIRDAWAQDIPVVGHNVGYDLTVLENENLRHWPNGGGVGPLGLTLCTFVIDKHFSWRKGSRKLVDVARFYGIQLSEEDAHGATADALAAARILWVMAKRYPKLAARTLSELFDDQISWHREQAASLRDYFASKGIDETVSLDWPIRVAEEAQVTP